MRAAWHYPKAGPSSKYPRNNEVLVTNEGQPGAAGAEGDGATGGPPAAIIWWALTQLHQLVDLHCSPPLNSF